MREDVSIRSKQLELFGKMHIGMDHVLAKLLTNAPPLPKSLKLQTETQSLGSTWAQVTETYEKRKLMLKRRKEKEKSKNKVKRSKEVGGSPLKEQEKMKEVENTFRHKTMRSHSSLNEAASVKKSLLGDKMEEKKYVQKKIGGMVPRLSKLKTKEVVKTKGEESTALDEMRLKKIRKLPLCGNVMSGSKKFRAIVKWMELDEDNNLAMSTELTELLKQLQLKNAPEKKRKSESSRKRLLESLDTASQVEEIRSKRKSLTEDQKRGYKESRSHEADDQVVYSLQEDKEKEKRECNKICSDSSDEAEFIPELQKGSLSPAKFQDKEETRLLKRQKKQVEKTKEKEAGSQMTSKEQLAAVVAKIRADEAVMTNESKYVSCKKKEQSVELGASLKSAIVLGDSDEEEEEYEVVIAGVEGKEAMEMQEQDSSTDDDTGVFDLNEEDVYVVDAILCVKEGRVLLSAGGLRRHKEDDLYLVKWDGYNELTWEPEKNIPRRLIKMFHEREVAKRACQYQIKVAHERREVINLTTQVKEIIYMIQWINQDLPVWELRTALPVKTQVWLEKILGATSAKTRRDTKSA